MAGTGHKVLVGCGIGCAVTALLAIVVTVGGGIFMTRPFNRAVDAQRELTAAYGVREEFVPSVQGLPRDRLKRFITVRRELAPLCGKFEQISGKFKAMEEFDRRDDKPSAGETFQAITGVMGAALGIAGNIGKFTEARNRALLAQEMSLGEYVWLYVLIYNSWLGYVPNESFGDGGDQGEYARSERRLIRTLMENYATALHEAGMMQEAEMWQAEADLVMDSETGVPFGLGGLPEQCGEGLWYWRGKLEGGYCGATSSFELSRIEKKGLSYRTD